MSGELKPYVIVPREATEEMVKTCGEYYERAHQYEAMLAARPASCIALEEAWEMTIAEIRAAFETRTVKDGVHCSDHALHNLEGAMIDIERTGKADAVSMRTLHRVASQLLRIGNVLTALAEAEAAVKKEIG